MMQRCHEGGFPGSPTQVTRVRHVPGYLHCDRHAVQHASVDPSKGACMQEALQDKLKMPLIMSIMVCHKGCPRHLVKAARSDEH